jgi:hypothetical protein
MDVGTCSLTWMRLRQPRVAIMYRGTIYRSGALGSVFGENTGCILQMRYAHGVPAFSPTVDGFRIAFRRPDVSFAEVLWRWSVGATAILLFTFGAFEYLSSLPVTSAEILFLRTKQPILVAKAIAHIFRGNWNRGMAAALLAALALMLLWMLAASFGRMATVRGLLDCFREDASRAHSGGNDDQPSAAVFRSLFRLGFLRIVAALAAVSSIVGAAVLAGFAFADSEPDPGAAFVIFAFVAALACFAWWMLNWFLSLAAVFAVRDDEDALAAISAAVALCHKRASAVFAVSFWTALLHLAVFSVATSVVFMPLALVGTIPWRVIVAAMGLITLVYFAIVDWIYIARLAGYVSIAEMPDTLPTPQRLDPTPRSGVPGAPIPSPLTAVDRDELILSDLPNLATET